MAEEIDPYHRWLGIPPGEQPPHCYRLLGLTLFEADPDVIETAADQRMAHLRTFQTGPHASLSQKLLNEVSAAKLCLLRPEKRAVYDAGLRAQLQRLAASAASAVPARSHRLPALIGSVAAGLLVVLGLVVWGLSGGKRPPDDEGKPASAKRSVADKPAGRAATALVEARRVPPPALLSPAAHATLSCNADAQFTAWDFIWSPVPGAKLYRFTLVSPDGKTELDRADTEFVKYHCRVPVASLPKGETHGWTWRVRVADGAEGSQDTGARELSVAVEEGSPALRPPWLVPGKPSPPAEKPAVAQSEPPSSPMESAATVPAPTEPGPAAPDTPAAPVRRAVPALAEQAKLLSDVSEAFAVGAAKRPEEQLKLAQRLLEEGKRAQGKPGEEFVLLRKGAELASEAGDAAVMLAALDAMAADFQVEAVVIKEKFLTRFLDATPSPARTKSFLETVGGAIDEAVAADRADLALNLVNLASRQAQTTSGKDYRKPIQERKVQLQKTYEQWQKYQEAQKTLQAHPADAAANLVAGRWCCLGKGDWERGLAYLAKGSDEGLKTLAQQDLRSPGKADAQVAIGDGWWDLAQKAEDADADPLRLRAGYWYQKANALLEGGLSKARIEKRLEEIAKLTKPKESVAKPVARTLDPTLVIKRGRWYDLLQRLDLERDVAAGQWQRSANGITNTSDRAASRLMFPVIADGPYDLELEFTPLGSNSVYVACQAGAFGCAVLLSSQELYVVSGLGNSTSSVQDHLGEIPMPTGVRRKIAVGVRSVRNTLGLEILFNATPPMAQWVPRFAAVPQLPSLFTLPEPKRPGFGIDYGSVALHVARFRLVTGSALWVSPRTAPGAGAAPDPGAVPGSEKAPSPATRKR